MSDSKVLRTFFVKVIIPCVEWGMALLAIYYTITRGFGGLPTTWTFNVSADLICMFINLFLIMGILLGTNKIDTSYSEFLLICHANFLSLFMDYCSWMMDGVVGSRNLMIFINTTLYLSNLLITAAYARFIVDSLASTDSRKKYYSIIYGFLAFSCLTRILNIKYGYFFTVSETAVYSRGPYQFVSYAYTIFIQIVVIYMLVKSDAPANQKKAVAAFTILPFAASILSIFVYGLSLMYACVLISIMMIYSAFFVKLEEDKGKLIENFEKYISNDVVQKIVNSPSDKLIEGRRYTATVLVSDIRGFTALSQAMKPDDLIDMLNHYYGVVTDIVYSFGGVVTEFLGDGIMCVFGAPKTRDDHADAAIACALTIQQKTAEINEWNATFNYPALQTGIGINSGTMVLGSLGNEKHAKYTAVGQTIDRCFDIESCSIGGQVLVSSSCIRSIKGVTKNKFLLDYVPNPDEFIKIKIYEIVSIAGTYDVEYQNKIIEPKALNKAKNVTYCIVDGKHISDEKHNCKIVSMSEDAAILETKGTLNVFENIKLQLTQKKAILAKVEEVSNKGIYVVFTSNIIEEKN